VFRILTREAHITSEGNITHEVRITFRASGTHRSKNKSTSYEVLLFLEAPPGIVTAYVAASPRRGKVRHNVCYGLSIPAPCTPFLAAGNASKTKKMPLYFTP